MTGLRSTIQWVQESSFLPGDTHENLQLLDAGCGTGGMLSALSRYGKVRGLDHLDEAQREVEALRAEMMRFRAMLRGLQSGITTADQGAESPAQPEE